jgi:hypothetical protein
LAPSLVVGVFLSRRVKNTSDFLIAGRKLGLLLTTATLSAEHWYLLRDIMPLFLVREGGAYGRKL